MKTLIYVSEYTPSVEPVNNVLNAIIKAAVKNNTQYGITGALLFHNNHFLQVLEGEPENISPIFEKIKNDPRHKNVQILYDKTVEKRNYSNWKMELFDLSDYSSFSKPVLEKVKELYDHNFQFNSADFLFLLQSLLNDSEFMAEVNFSQP